MRFEILFLSRLSFFRRTNRSDFVLNFKFCIIVWVGCAALLVVHPENISWCGTCFWLKRFHMCAVCICFGSCIYLYLCMYGLFQWNYSTFAHWISMIMVINVHFYCPRLTLLIFFLLYFGFCFNFWSLSLFFWCCFYRHIYLFTYKHELIVWFKNLIKKATSKNAVHLSFCLRLAQDWETLKTLNSNLTSIICWLLEERNIAIAL